MADPKAKYEVYKSISSGEWYWRYKSKNGRTIARSTDGYKNKSDCEHSISLIKTSAFDEVVEL